MEREHYHIVPWAVLTLSLFGMIVAIAIAIAIAQQTVFAGQHLKTPCDPATSSFCVAPRLLPATNGLQAAAIPKIATPAWMAQQVSPPQPQPAARTVTYSVQTRGTISANLDEFKTFASQTLNDSRGWSRLGVVFSELESGGDFTLYLSEASQMTSFSADGCDSTYSCRVGRAVIINQDRWLNPTSSWTDGGGNLSDYRAMALNHETGHWLGHGHTFCSSAGSSATVMQQQSIDLQGCSPNPWPLSSEMYAPNLGIRS